MGARVSIGDFAVMTSLSRKALRHYHDIGILEPAHIDSHTGYRFYDTSQVDHAHIIRRFRSLGMSIPDIKALLSTEDAAARTEIITTHLEQMEVQLQQTRDTVGALRELLLPCTPPPTWSCAMNLRSPCGPSAPPSRFPRSTVGSRRR